MDTHEAIVLAFIIAGSVGACAVAQPLATLAQDRPALGIGWNSNRALLQAPFLAQLPGERDDDYPERPAFRSVQCWEMPADPTLIRCTDGFWRRLLPDGAELQGYERFEPPAERPGRSATPVSETER